MISEQLGVNDGLGPRDDTLLEKVLDDFHDGHIFKIFLSHLLRMMNILEWTRFRGGLLLDRFPRNRSSRHGLRRAYFLRALVLLHLHYLLTMHLRLGLLHLLHLLNGVVFFLLARRE